NGGFAVVQEPSEAVMADMPRNALRLIEPDFVLPAADISDVLESWVAGDIRARRPSGGGSSPAAGRRSQVYSCPECGGPLMEAARGRIPHFTCLVGHGFSWAQLPESQAQSTERALWMAERALKERAQILGRLANEAKSRKNVLMVRHFEEKRREFDRHVEALRT